MPSTTIIPTSDQLYHIKRTITDLSTSPSGPAHKVDIISTYTDLKLAKEAARQALFSEGYLKDDFEIYEENINDETWTHDQGVRVYAKAPAGQIFEVRLDTKPNTLDLKGGVRGAVDGPLFYVLETIINYNSDRTGDVRTTEVEGTYLTLASALTASKTALLSDEIMKASFTEYDEKDDARDVDEWPYGDDVYIHAVSSTGENFLISVKGKPQSQ